jgi:hypothetical protein
MNINMHDSTEASAKKHDKHSHRYIERWMNINMHDSTEGSAKKHDKQKDYDMTSAVGTCKPMSARVPPAAA